MKRTSKLFLYSLTSLSLIPGLTFAEELATAPTLEGGITASIGTFYAVPSAGNQDYVGAINPKLYVYDPETHGNNTEIDPVFNNAEYDFGFEASLGYIFEDTANGVELSYRTLNSSASDSSTGTFIFDDGDTVMLGGNVTANNNLDYDFDNVDLMISQFLDVGTHMQVRFLAGISWARIEQDKSTDVPETFYSGTQEMQDVDYASRYDTTFNAHQKSNSEFSGICPTLGLDGRYDFGENIAGFGIVAGASVAYLLGSLDIHNSAGHNFIGNVIPVTEKKNLVACEYLDLPGGGYNCLSQGNSSDDTEINNHGVLNLRGNIGVDYVYFFDNEELSTIGLELGYQVDYYADSVGQIEYDQVDCPTCGYDTDLFSTTFSGPYLNLKGTF